METYNGIVCISRSSLIISKNNPNGLLTRGNYDYYQGKGTFETVRLGGGEGNSTLIAFDSLPTKYQKMVKEMYGDPKVEAQKEGLLKDIKISDEAVRFFKEYTIEYSDNIKSLPNETQTLYVNNAAVLDALRIAWEEHAAMRKGKSGKRPLTGLFWKNASLATQRLISADSFAHDLPKNPRRLQMKLQEYIKEGYDCLVSKKFANTNSVKITDEAGDWLVARWSSMFEIVTTEQLFAEYNLIADAREWEKLKSSQSIYDYLHKPEIEPKWHAARYGELSFKEKYPRQNRTILPTRRDSLWYSDGTKLNYYYQDENGNIRTCNVYEVMDVYSEMLLGYHISPTEDFEAQYYAYKMAIERSGHKPYELKYDNQGGHKKLERSDLLKNLARHAINTAPYNGKSKTIESAFGRFQSQFLHKEWYFTGQNITATKKSSRTNMEFILANSKNLPTLEEVKAQYLKRREEWNNAAHHGTGIAKCEMYRTSANDETKRVDRLDMISIFGITTKDPATYRNSGIEIQVKKKKYAYEVLTAEGMPDMDFYRRNVGRKLHTRYCPDDMSIVSLYEKDATGMRFIAMAQSFIHVKRAMQDQTSADLEMIRWVENTNKQMRIDNAKESNDLLAANNMHPNQHGLNVAPLKGVNTSKAKKGKIDIGELQKEVSNMTELEEKKKEAKRTIKRNEQQIEKSSKNEQSEFDRKRIELLQAQLN